MKCCKCKKTLRFERSMVTIKISEVECYYCMPCFGETYTKVETRGYYEEEAYRDYVRAYGFEGKFSRVWRRSQKGGS